MKQKTKKTKYTQRKTGSKRVSKSKRRTPTKPSRAYTTLRDRANANAAAQANFFAANPTVRTPVEKVDGDRNFTTIENVASFRNPIGAVAVMIRKAGNVAAEHQHVREGHVCHLVTGRALYRERRGGPETGPARYTYQKVMNPGDAVFSPPDVPHAFLFTAPENVMVVVANISRTKIEYESDVRRLPDEKKLFTPAEVAAFDGSTSAAHKFGDIAANDAAFNVVAAIGRKQPEDVNGEPV